MASALWNTSIATGPWHGAPHSEIMAGQLVCWGCLSHVGEHTGFRLSLSQGVAAAGIAACTALTGVLPESSASIFPCCCCHDWLLPLFPQAVQHPSATAMLPTQHAPSCTAPRTAPPAGAGASMTQGWGLVAKPTSTHPHSPAPCHSATSMPLAQLAPFSTARRTAPLSGGGASMTPM